jgi:hypothetical protein
MSGYPASALPISRAPPSDSRRVNPSFLECQDRVHLLNARRALPDSRGHSLDAPAARIPAANMPGRLVSRSYAVRRIAPATEPSPATAVPP